MKAPTAHLLTRLGWLAILAAGLLSMAANAEQPLPLAIGQTKVLSVSDRITHVSVDNPNVVHVRMTQLGVVFEGKQAGQSPVYLKTAEGIEIELTVYVTTAGYDQYSRISID